jgi:hypothetical protein
MMSFMPRYSLLTLLVVTALVAGGVKLWYGPHRVIDRVAMIEVEYTYTRDWRGNKIKQGPSIARWFEEDTYYLCMIGYYRKGEELPWIFRAELQQIAKPRRTEYPDELRPLSDSRLDPLERIEFQEAIERERQRLMPTDESIKRLEYQGPEIDFR